MSLTDQANEASLQKKIQDIRRRERNDKISIVLAPILIIVGWPLYNFVVYHYVPFGVVTKHPYRWIGFLLIVLGIVTIVINIVHLAYLRLQKKKYMEQLRQM